MRIAYVILHYNTEKDTYACVDSIKAKHNSNIIIVCNNSPNGSDSIVDEHYSACENVFVIRCAENLGFARGNNVGIDYVREHDLGEIVVCLNNDIIVDADFESEVLKSYAEEAWAVAGPDVVNPYGVHCNPRYEEYPSPENVKKTLKKTRNAINRCNTLGGIGEYIFCTYRRLFEKIGKADHDGDSKKIMTVHGCCVIFSPEFFKQFEGFCPDTYLYGEEIILSYMCAMKGLIIKYIDGAQVLHNESGGTKAELKNLIKRHLFYYKNYYDSSKVLLRIVSGK